MNNICASSIALALVLLTASDLWMHAAAQDYCLGGTRYSIASSGKVSCFMCPKGQFSKGGRTSQCSVCPNGRTTLRAGVAAFSTDCNRCPAGYKYVSASNSCVACGFGFWAPERAISRSGSDTCFACKSGFTTATDTAVSRQQCRGCAPGYAGTDCHECAPGQWSTGGLDTTKLRCQPCPTGRDQPAVAGPFTRQQLTANTACNNLLPGYEWRTAVASDGTVKLCDKGKFNVGGTSGICNPCLDFTTTTGTGAKSVAECTMCQPGYGKDTANPGKCVMCLKDSWSAGQAKTEECMKCPDGFAASKAGAREGNACSECAPGFGGPDCDKCPADFFSIGGIIDDVGDCTRCPDGYTTQSDPNVANVDCPVCAPGYGFANGKCQECPYGSYSPGGTTAACLTCPLGFTTAETGAETSAECAVCKAGYGGGSCTLCPRGTYSNGGAAAIIGCKACGPNLTTPSTGTTDAAECSQSCKLQGEVCGANDECCTVGATCTSGTCPP